MESFFIGKCFWDVISVVAGNAISVIYLCLPLSCIMLLNAVSPFSFVLFLLFSILASVASVYSLLR